MSRVKKGGRDVRSAKEEEKERRKRERRKRTNLDENRSEVPMLEFPEAAHDDPC